MHEQIDEMGANAFDESFLRLQDGEKENGEVQTLCSSGLLVLSCPMSESEREEDPVSGPSINPSARNGNEK